MSTLTETSRNVPTNEPALSIIFSELRTEINRYYEMSNQLYAKINQLKYMELPDPACKPEEDRLDKDCIGFFNTEIDRFRKINNDIERLTLHLYTIVGS